MIHTPRLDSGHHSLEAQRIGSMSEALGSKRYNAKERLIPLPILWSFDQ